ncbi:hypothetical protein BO83DRAFT_404478 [Aspergillus eucalypticola CBS 122712]|uniref:Uncharacterized protein n=1 Tax=Aspergillus eucalypticola (strain CBS 122712 / IBT 29274) TaxID=1448314 RepID=A0A317UL80_ASPEC|nr:uncharacterized protein BO83DRAFT_404478 [Aspergillus eucalypticola CBS 122712]PWY61447.1 hypothetical protein BO83DRAFT_404478 [Aspergillus eucalypticola CBS 122712]
MWILHGNVTERGDIGGGPGKSSLFFLTAYHPEIEPCTFAGSGAPPTILENPREGIVFTPGRTHNRSRSPRIGSKAGQPAGAPQHRVGDALGRLRPSGGRLTTNLELVRTRGI